jgi:hypothetical protein
MVSFRPKAWLALTALALQLVLSFTHVHFEGAYGVHYRTAAAGATFEAYKLSVPDPADAGDNYCAICASIYLVASSVLPEAPQLPVVFAFRTIERGDQVAFTILVPRRTLFQSRAPPLA